jgi:hypothetical protein
VSLEACRRHAADEGGRFVTRMQCAPLTSDYRLSADVSCPGWCGASGRPSRAAVQIVGGQGWIDDMRFWVRPPWSE